MCLPALLPADLRVSGLTALLQVFSNTSLKCTHTMEGCIPPPPAQGFCFFGGGGGCFSVPADVNKIARWHFNALQRDRSLLLLGSRGSHSFAFQKWSKAFAHCVGKDYSAPSGDPEGLLWDIVTLSESYKRHA